MTYQSTVGEIEEIRESIRTIVDSRDIIADVIYTMVENVDPTLAWYATMLRQCRIEYDESLDAPAAVYYSQQRGRFIILFNRYLCAALPYLQISALLKHEFGHIFMMHFEREETDDYGLNVKSTYEKRLLDMAMDYTINGDRYNPLIAHIPGSFMTFVDGKTPQISGVFWSDINEIFNLDYEVTGKETYADFYRLLYQNPKEKINSNTCSTCVPSEFASRLKKVASNGAKRNKNGSIHCEENGSKLNSAVDILIGNTPIGNNHDRIKEREEMDKIPTTDRDKLFRDKYEEFKRIAHEATQNRGFEPSNISGHLIEIDKRLKSVNWKKILRKALAKSLRSLHLESSYQRQNRILPDDPNIPGVKRKKQPIVGVIIDVSGSVSDVLIAQAMNDIVRLSKRMGASIEAVQVDIEIKKIDKIKKTTASIQRQGRGGTIMEPGFEYFMKRPLFLRPSVIVCVSDGYIESQFSKLKLPKTIETVFVIPEGNELAFECASLSGRCTIVPIKLDKNG